MKNNSIFYLNLCCLLFNVTSLTTNIICTYELAPAVDTKLIKQRKADAQSIAKISAYCVGLSLASTCISLCIETNNSNIVQQSLLGIFTGCAMLSTMITLGANFTERMHHY